MVQHIPVLLEEVLAGLNVGPGAHVIDGTLGAGGHTKEILLRSAPNGRVLGLDRDPVAIRQVKERFPEAVDSGRLLAVQSAFDHIQAVAFAHDFMPVDGILLDLGVSSPQIEMPERGFSFVHSGPLDMRFDPNQDENAADIVNTLTAEALADLFYRYGEERYSRRIARYLVAHRPIDTTAELARLVEAAVGGRRGKRIHPATQTFQALRIAVNDELGQLERALPQCLNLLQRHGRLAVISFHSLEDRIVKHWMRDEARSYVHDPTVPSGGYSRTPRLQVLTGTPLTPSDEEARRNPRSRSAKLRLAERI